MERATFKVSFFVKRIKKLKDGTSPIFVRIMVNRERAEFGIQESIDLNEWDAYQANQKKPSSVGRLGFSFELPPNRINAVNPSRSAL